MRTTAHRLPKLSAWSTWAGGSYSVATAYGNFSIDPRYSRPTRWDRFPHGNTWSLRFENVRSASPSGGLHQQLGTFRTPAEAVRAANRFYSRLTVSSRDARSRRVRRR